VSNSDIIQFPQGADIVDRAGNDVLVKLQRAAGIAEQNTQHAVALAHQAAMQLRVAEDKIARLEAEVWSYKERAERAEGWLQRISQEIEQTFPVRGQQQQQPDDYAPKRPNIRR
jgi:hypothetical protein